MRVCHLTSVHSQEDTRIFHKECVSLAKAGYEVYEISCGKNYEKNGVHIIGVEKAEDSRIKRFLGTTRNVYEKALELDAEIYHAHDPELLPTLMKLRRKGKIVIFDSHEHTAACIDEKDYLPKPMRKLVRGAYESYQTRCCRKVDAVITATPNITEYFKQKGCSRVIDLCNFPILKKEFTQPAYDSGKISFAGGISPQWNHVHIVNAVNNVDGARYELCGVDEGDYLEQLKQLPGWSKVDFLGKMPFEKVAALLESSAIGMSLLTPGANTDGTNGNMANTKIFEEMMAGLPVICTNFRRWKDFVETDRCGICVDPQNEEQIANAIQYLFDHPDEARQMGLNGRKLVETRFNWENEEKKLLALYAELAAQIKEKKHD